MARPISLSLLWATVQLAFVLASSTACTDVEHSAQYNWTWKLEFCASNKKRFTLEIVAQTLENCSSTCSSETTDYNQRKALDFCLRVGNGTIKLSENDTVCNTQPECHPNVTVNNTPINFTQGKNECIAWKSQNHAKVKINFKCAANDNSLNLDLQNTNKSWIDALEECEKNNTSLVEISNSAVRDKVESLLQNYTGLQGGVWVGLERSVFGYNAEWTWISGCKVVDSQLNQSVSASNDSNPHCGMITYVGNEIKWQEANCHNKLPFICQSWIKTSCTRNVNTENSELSIDIGDESGNNLYEDCK